MFYFDPRVLVRASTVETPQQQQGTGSIVDLRRSSPAPSVFPTYLPTYLCNNCKRSLLINRILVSLPAVFFLKSGDNFSKVQSRVAFQFVRGFRSTIVSPQPLNFRSSPTTPHPHHRFWLVLSSRDIPFTTTNNHTE